MPGDDDHVMYVWVDALANYISALGFPDNDGEFGRWRDRVCVDVAAYISSSQTTVLYSHVPFILKFGTESDFFSPRCGLLQRAAPESATWAYLLAAVYLWPNLQRDTEPPARVRACLPICAPRQAICE